jgi:hypothetical protein
MGLKYVYTTTLLGLRGHSLTVPVIETPDSTALVGSGSKTGRSSLQLRERWRALRNRGSETHCRPFRIMLFFVGIRCLHFSGFYAHSTHVYALFRNPNTRLYILLHCSL